jgi:toxin ParE1/3/4
MNPRVWITPVAREDLAQIWAYIAAERVTAADAFVRELAARMQLLAAHPMSGHARADLAENLRSSAVGNFVVFYLPLDDGIEIIRVLHGAMNIQPDCFT